MQLILQKNTPTAPENYILTLRLPIYVHGPAVSAKVLNGSNVLNVMN